MTTPNLLGLLQPSSSQQAQTLDPQQPSSSGQADGAQPPPTKIPKSMQYIRARNRKSFNQCVSKGKKWIQKTSPFTPSFSLLYWRVDKCRSQLEWFGPDHMAEFVNDSLVQEKFKQVALKTPLFGERRDEGDQVIDESCTSRSAYLPVPLPLFSSNDDDYIADVLYLVLPRIMNPNGIRGNFYALPNNRPFWFPDDLPFISPTHKKSTTEGKFTVNEMKQIFRAFLDNCPDSYTIDPDNSPFRPRIRKTTQRKSYPKRSTQNGDTSDPDRQSSNPPFQNAHEMLTYLTSSSGWMDLKTRVLSLPCQSEVEKVRDKDKVYLREIPKEKLDRRRKQVLNVPDGYYPATVYGDGNCLFRAISMALFGDEEQSTLLRLAAVWQAVTHYDHYVEMYINALQDVGDAHQFLSAVIKSDEQFSKRPQDSPTVSNLVHYMLQSEIANCVQLGTYSGPLHVQFVAGAINRRVILSYEMYDDSAAIKELFPCGCFGDKIEVLDEVHLMWVVLDPDKNPTVLNHIIPLIPKSSRVLNTKIPKELNVSFKYCLMERYGQCAIHLLGDPNDPSCTEGIPWIACDSCGSWFHSACLGFSAPFCEARSIYCLCKTLPPERDDTAFEKRIGGCNLRASISDVRTLYPNRGLSDTIVDLYVRNIPRPRKQPSPTVVLGALSYSALEDVLNKAQGTLSQLDKDNLTRRFKSTCGLHPKDLVSPGHEKVVFPCSLSDEWHWITVVVLPQQQCAFVMDSLSDSSIASESHRVIKNIEKLFKVADSSFTLTPHHYEIPLQSGVNCGLHAMHNVRVAVRHSVKEFEERAIPHSSLKVNPKMMRAQLLVECCEYNTEYNKTRQSQTAVTGMQLRSQVKSLAIQLSHEEITDKLDSKLEDGLEVRFISDEKGRGVFAKKPFVKTDYVCEYAGETITRKEGVLREKLRIEDPLHDNSKCYMYFFTAGGKRYCIDATTEQTERMGRYANHSKTSPNVVARCIVVEGRPRLYFVATTDIRKGDEILYNYQDDDKSSLQANPWLKK